MGERGTLDRPARITRTTATRDGWRVSTRGDVPALWYAAHNAQHGGACAASDYARDDRPATVYLYAVAHTTPVLSRGVARDTRDRATTTARVGGELLRDADTGRALRVARVVRGSLRVNIVPPAYLRTYLRTRGDALRASIAAEGCGV